MIFRRLWDWLVAKPRPTLLSSIPTGRGEPTEISESEWRQLIELNRNDAYSIGLAQGELRGRMALAKEIEAQFGKPITEDEAHRIVGRQVH